MSKTWFGCFVFENDHNPSGVFEPISMFQTSAGVNGIVFFEDGGQSCFYACQTSGNAIYEYTYTPASADPQLAPLPAVSLSNYPNPFNPSTEIRFQMSDASHLEHAQIEIFNVKGQKVRKLKADMSSRPQRTCAAPFRSKEGMESRDLSYSITWDGTDSANQPVASGVYLYQLRAGKQTLAQKKMMLLK
jgi:hypothetical protein